MTRTYSFLLSVLLFTWSCSAASKYESIFDEVGRNLGIDPIILYGLAVQESSPPDQHRPWPWTINVAGKGYWFNTKSEAVEAIKIATRLGIQNIDIGMMQINWKWHGHHFKSYSEALDPKRNLETAASILKTFKNYPIFVAIGKYHCPSKVPWCERAAQEYAVKVVNRIKSLL
ncbi:transglycosylase SLT domain-containing protein [Hydrogenovibrio sp. SC-1]|uniref:transglycosylase SLT domain-containing protein n=1 Tax=Hydrogenovibrio sp. SC-1 TaxID=2065820 RepID=UPI0013042C36|nr:transglycosylase SLT domain-containing protein [Hydrogenovibrio sp. SC-1]